MVKTKFYSIVFLGTIILTAAIFISASYIFFDNKKMGDLVYRDVIYENIYVENIDLSGKMIDEAEKILEQKFLPEIENHKITFKYGEILWEMNFKDVNAGYEISKALQEAYDIGRKGSLRERYNIIIGLKENPRNISLKYIYDEMKVLEFLENIERQVNIEVKNSEFVYQNGIFTGTDEIVGKKLDKENLIFQTKELLNGKQSGIIELVVLGILPQYTKSYYENMNNHLGKFSTVISEGVENRTENIKVAASKINGILLYPQEIFSTSKKISPIEETNGYLTAPVIINGKLEDGVGGGVCQVATTLYNAVINSELEIVERQSHSRPVGYVDLGMDAAIAGDYFDLKFKNSTNYPIYIESNVEGNILNVNIYGYKDKSILREISFESQVVEIIEPPEQRVVKDDTKFQDEIEVIKEAKVGYTVVVYKNVYKDGVLTDKIEFSRSTYKPVQAEIRVGTKIRQ